MTKALRFGVQTPPQNTSWQELLDTWKLIEEAGYDTAWTFDHFFPIFADPSGSCFEGWTILTALAAATGRIEVGALVTGNTYRHPAVLANMGATLDHTCGGRLIMGIGAAWFELEHNAYGIPFHTVGERIRRLDEACEIIKRLWSQPQTTFAGRYYKITDAYCEPKPLRQPRPPLMIGGAGEKLMLRVVAKHADQWNTFGSPEVFKHKIALLQEHCQAINRNADEIEVSWSGTVHLTASQEEKEAVISGVSTAMHLSMEEAAQRVMVGAVAEVSERLQQYVEAGVTHFILSMMPPFHRPTIQQFAEQVMPQFRR
ncbi:MAG: LLM class F420-dependent oxidoreductase [Acidobacteria bacterium]|nr:LLM class F420-dependent oxidoreductase [Acidobacteriota bacterium]